MTNLIGQSLGRYHILEQLGEGGMAVVYKAYDTRLETDVAVKVIRTDNIPPRVLERTIKRFDREAKALAKLTHANIVQVIDYGDHEGNPYLVMPYLPGGTLKERLRGKPIPWQEATRLLLPVARALDFAHRQGLVHRDVKPSNIIITADGDPMLTDFGIAKILDLEETLELTATGAAVGTPEYMAPEQATSNVTDHRVDIYALGVVLYEMVTGRKPYIADTPMAVVIKHANEPLPRPRKLTPNLPRDVENILLKALAKSPDDRYQSMGELVTALEGLVDGRASRKSQVDKKQETTQIWSGNPVFWIVTSIISMSLIGMVLFFSKGRGNFPPPTPTNSAGILLSSPSPSQEAGEKITPTLLSTATSTIAITSTTPPEISLTPEATQDIEPSLTPSDSTSITVQANVRWQDSGIMVGQGDTVKISRVSGRWRGTVSGDYVNGMNCQGSFSSGLLPSAPGNSLIAKIDDSAPFCVGKTPEFVSQYSGKLYFSYNDCEDLGCFNDNDGSLVLKITVTTKNDLLHLTETEQAPMIYDDFNDPLWNGKINSDLWITRENCGAVSQENNNMVFRNKNSGCDLVITQPRKVRGDELGSLEARLMVGSDHVGGIVTQEIDFFTYDLPGGLWYSFCGVFADNGHAKILFSVENPGAKKSPELQKTIPAKYEQWYTIRLEVNPQTMRFSCFVDGVSIGGIVPNDAEALRSAQFERLTEAMRFQGTSTTSFVDYIKLLP